MIDLSFLVPFLFPESISAFFRITPFGGFLAFFDLWFVFHFVVAFYSFTILRNFFKKKTAFNLVLIGIIVVEIVESGMVAQGLIMSETFVNSLLDVLVGFWALRLSSQD